MLVLAEYTAWRVVEKETNNMLFPLSYIKWTTKKIKKLRRIQSSQAISVVAVHRH